VIADNLTTLFTPAADGVRFRQGTILAWNAATGENTIDLAGGTLTDVPILNTGEAVALKAGHVVGMLGQGSSWFILGRVTPPNDPNFAGASVAFDGTTATAVNFGLSTSLTDLISSTLTVPNWADEAIVLATSSCQLTNTRAAIDFATIQTRIDGAGGSGVQTGFSPFGDASGNYVGTMACSYQRLISSPGATITVSTALNAQGAAWGVQASNRATVDAIAIFRSTV
jgi:hypothetical protein